MERYIRSMPALQKLRLYYCELWCPFLVKGLQTASEDPEGILLPNLDDLRVIAYNTILDADVVDMVEHRLRNVSSHVARLRRVCPAWRWWFWQWSSPSLRYVSWGRVGCGISSFVTNVLIVRGTILAIFLHFSLCATQPFLLYVHWCNLCIAHWAPELPEPSTTRVGQ